MQKNSLLALRSRHAACTPPVAVPTVHQLIWVRPDPTGPSHLTAVPREPDQNWSDFNVDGVSASATVGTQELIEYAGWLAESGWTVTKFTLRTGANEGLSAVRATAYNAILLDDMAAGGATEVMETLTTELRGIYVGTVRARHGADRLEIHADGHLTIGDPTEIIALLNARINPRHRRNPRTAPAEQPSTLWARITRKAR